MSAVVAGDSLVRHPAKYSAALRPVIAELISRQTGVVDQFGGVGGIHSVAEEAGVPLSIAVEIELEWASQWESTDDRFTICGDSRNLASLIQGTGRLVDAVAFSPDYGNRMADHHEAKDKSKRNTYRHYLGRMPSEGATTVTYFQKGGKNTQYEEMHAAIWKQVHSLMTGPSATGSPSHRRVVCNVSDFLRTQSSERRQPLSKYERVVETTDKMEAAGRHRVQCLAVDWHADMGESVGFRLEDRIQVATKRNRLGANRDVRVECEEVLVFGLAHE